MLLKCNNLKEPFKPDFRNHLTEDFFIQPAEIVAKELLGTILIKKEESDTIAGVIVETEAYLHQNDMSSHSYVGLTNRNKAMFERGGILYVYRSYGIHHCINIVTEDKGIGSAVLIRAIEPIFGIDIMMRHRGISDRAKLCKGPGNLSKAFNFTIEDNFTKITTPYLFIQKNADYSNNQIFQTKRIGISKSVELELRFYLKNSIFISRK